MFERDFKYRNLVFCTVITWPYCFFFLFLFFDTLNAQMTGKEVPDWLKSILFHSMIDPVISCRGIQIYGFRERDSGSLIATPMHLQFGLYGAFVLSIFALWDRNGTAWLNCPTIFKSMFLGDISALRYSISGLGLAFNYLHLSLCNISILYVIICFSWEWEDQEFGENCLAFVRFCGLSARQNDCDPQKKLMALNNTLGCSCQRNRHSWS